MNYLLAGIAVATVAAATPRLTQRVSLSRAKHRSLAGHARISRLIASRLPAYSYGDDQFFAADDAPSDVIERRREGFAQLSAEYERRFACTVAATAGISPAISDLQFTARYRVPFQFRDYLGTRLSSGSMLQSSHGCRVTDLDGNELIDVTGAYGVNLLGHEFYKRSIAAGSAAVVGLGPVLGPYHPVIAYNVRRLREISGLDEVSFHMSGTEAVMQAVRLARYHTRRRYLVRFAGAYHGWWGDVQPGVGNPAPAKDTLTLADLSERSLAVLRRRKDIACVLVNPLQALHPNAAAPADNTLVDSGRRAGFDREAYSRWLQRLREVCTGSGIPLIFDEVFVGFRLAPGGAQEYFGVRADLVTYGKTLGGGLPVGVVCGRADLMRRWREERPADICFARGTFNSHPYVMGAMAQFLEHLETPDGKAAYDGMDPRWNARAHDFNQRMQELDLPLRVANLSTIWTLWYAKPSRYNWMLQYYLKAEGLQLSWVGTGRLIFSLDMTDEDYQEVARRMERAACRMREDAWWWSGTRLTDRDIRRRVARELLQAWVRPWFGSMSSPRSK